MAGVLSVSEQTPVRTHLVGQRQRSRPSHLRKPISTRRSPNRRTAQQSCAPRADHRLAAPSKEEGCVQSSSCRVRKRSEASERMRRHMDSKYLVTSILAFRGTFCERPCCLPFPRAKAERKFLLSVDVHMSRRWRDRLRQTDRPHHAATAFERGFIKASTCNSPARKN